MPAAFLAATREIPGPRRESHRGFDASGVAVVQFGEGFDG